MKKIILFGASRGGMNYLKNYCEHQNILAVVDNDIKKQGNKILDIPIISIDEIHNFRYDYIVVTSMYVHSITEQLIDFGIEEEKIKYASKNSIKVTTYPFKNGRLLECANEMIIFLSKILKDIKYFHTFGTLLGIVRDGKLIPWDDDIDIAIFSDDALEVKGVLLENVDYINLIMQTKIYVRRYSNGEIASISIDCFDSGEQIFNINLDCIYIVGNTAIQELNKTPVKFFEKVEKINFNGHMIKVPHHYEEYLTYTYGDWKTVKKHTSFYDNTLSFVEPTRSCTRELFYDGVTDEKRI